jgi:hypothetical protein
MSAWLASRPPSAANPAGPARALGGAPNKIEEINKTTMATLTVAKNPTAQEHRHLNGHHADLLSTIVGPVASLLEQISGPAMTDHDRLTRDLAEARFYSYTGFAGY